MSVYQAASGKWLVFNNGIKSEYFNTESEAVAMSEKIVFAEEVQAFSTQLSQLVEKAPPFQAIWDDREYLSGADGKAITDADLESLGITKAELTAFITPFIPQIFNFMNNLTVTEGDFSATLNKLRTDL